MKWRGILVLVLFAMPGFAQGASEPACGIHFDAFDVVVGNGCPGAWPDLPLLEAVDKATALHGAFAIETGSPSTNVPGAAIAMIDRGIHADHPGLQGRLHAYHMDGGRLVPGPHPDPHGDHGTKVATLAAGDGGGSPENVYRGMSPTSPVYAVDLTDRFTVSGALAGFEWILENHERLGIRVALNAWSQTGADGHYDPADPLAKAAQALVDAGILVVLAAGNQGNRSMMPATLLPGVLTVGAVDGTGRLASFSNRGPSSGGAAALPWTKPDIVAVGRALVAGRAPQTPIEEATGALFNDPDAAQASNAYGDTAGTSMAAAIAAGAAARLATLVDEEGSMSQVHDALRVGAWDLGDPGPDTETGWGFLDVPAAARILRESPDPAGLQDAHAAAWGATWNLVGSSILGLELGPAVREDPYLEVPVPPATRSLELFVDVGGVVPGSWKATAGYPGGPRIPLQGDESLRLRIDAPHSATWTVRVEPESALYQADVAVRAEMQLAALRHGDVHPYQGDALLEADQSTPGMSWPLLAFALALAVAARRQHHKMR